MTTLSYGLIEGELPPALVRGLTPGNLMELVENGLYSKATLAAQLVLASRDEFLAASAAIEKQLTDECAAEEDFCIGSECAVKGEVCLEAVLKARPRYAKALAAEWIRIFANPDNRIGRWRT